MPPGRNSRRPTLRVSAFIAHEGRVLLVRQARGHSTYWLLPGGAVERGESLQTALQRELREECGLDVSVDHRPLGIVESISPDGGASRHVVHLIFAAALLPQAAAERGLPTCRPSDPAVLEADWIPAAALDSLVLHPPISDLVGQWLELLSSTRSSTATSSEPTAGWPAAISTGPRWTD